MKLYTTFKVDEHFVSDALSGTTVFGNDNIVVFPGFCDVHVHFREPGFSYKETVKTGSLSAGAGGYTDVCTMPNLKPAPDTKENLSVQLDIIKKDAKIGVHPLGTITKGQNGCELADFEEMKDLAIAFSDDGRGSTVYPLSSVRGYVSENCIYKTEGQIVEKRNGRTD